jgi:hypothetical protein
MYTGELFSENILFEARVNNGLLVPSPCLLISLENKFVTVTQIAFG